MEIVNEANEKFKDKQDEVCGFLFDILRRLNELEAEVYGRNEELKKSRPEPHIIAPGEKELWNEYEERTGEIVKPVCTEKLLKRRYGGQFGNPTAYGYIDGECKAVFTMKSAGKAVVAAYFKKGIEMMHKFVLKNTDGSWLIDEIYYGFQSEPDKWYTDAVR